MLLQGFDFNGNARLTATVYAPYAAIINRNTGLLEVHINAFSPESQVVVPSGTTHFRLISAGAEVDFEADQFRLAQSSSIEIPYNSTSASTIALSNDLGVQNSTKPLFLLLGIEFLQQVNGEFYSLNNGAFNALNLVQVDTGV